LKDLVIGGRKGEKFGEKGRYKSCNPQGVRDEMFAAIVAIAKGVIDG